MTRKITRAAARIKLGLQETLFLGNLEARRDWGHARDFVEAMWLMLQQPEPEDFVIATGEDHSVREFVELAFKEVGIAINWRGRGVEEEGLEQGSDRILVKINPRYFRPTEVDTLLGDATKARTILGWQPRSSFKEMVREMVVADLKEAERELLCRRNNF